MAKENPYDELRRFLETSEISEEEIEKVLRETRSDVLTMVRSLDIMKIIKQEIFNRIFNPHRLYLIGEGDKRRSYVTYFTNQIRGYPFTARLCEIVDNKEIFSHQKLPVGKSAHVLPIERYSGLKPIPVGSVLEVKTLNEEEGIRIRDLQPCFVYLLEGKDKEIKSCAVNSEGLVYNGEIFHPSIITSYSSSKKHPYSNGTEICLYPYPFDIGATVGIGYKIIDSKSFQFGELNSTMKRFSPDSKKLGEGLKGLFFVNYEI